MTIFSSLAPVFSVLSGWFFLSEKLDYISILGFVVITFSVYILFLKPNRNLNWLEIILQPFNSIFNSKPTLFAFLSIIPPAISVVFVKKAVIDCDALSFSLFFTFMIGILSLIICLFSNKKNIFISQINLIPKSFFWLSGLLLAINQFSFALASREILVANLMALIRISSVFQILFAYYILNEKTDIKRRLLVSIFIILGFCITTFSENFD